MDAINSLEREVLLADTHQKSCSPGISAAPVASWKANDSSLTFCYGQCRRG